MIPAGNYLLVGRTGVGKSSLINTIAQSSLASVDCSSVCTKTIAPYAFDTPAGSYVLYDSPGFCEDDNPETDAEYLSKIKIFLNRKKIEACEISVLFTVRLGATRVRSEDHEVVKYLAELLIRFRLPVVLAATWADFTRSDESVRRQLDLARIQYLAMIDKALLELTDKKLCAAGFDGAYAVDNESAAWMSSWKPLRLKHEQLTTLESYAVTVGHSITFLSSWLSASNSASYTSAEADKLDLLAGRIENLTRYPFQQDLLLPDFLGVNSSGISPEIDKSETSSEIDQSEGSLEIEQTEGPHEGLVPYFYIDDASLLSSIDELSRGSIKKMFGIRSLDAGAFVLRRLSESHAECCTLMRPIVSSRGLNSQMCSHLVSLYAARTILEGLYISLNRADVALYRNRTPSGAFLLEERIASFGSLLSSLLSLAGKAYLLDETNAFIEASFYPSRCHQFAQVKKHFLNCMEILYLSVVFAEWSLFPRPLEVFKDQYWSIDSEDVLSWIATSSPLYGYSELVLKVFRAGDWRTIVELAMDCPSSMSIFLEDITRSLSRKTLLVSDRMLLDLSEARALGDDFTEAPF